MRATPEKLAAAKAVIAWRAKRATPDRLAGFDAAEAAAITGVPVPMLDKWYDLGLLHPSVWSSQEDGDYGRYSELDLLRAVIVAELDEAGVPLLALALIAAALENEHAEEGDWLELIDRQRIPTAYPLTVATAERWLRFRNVTATLWSAACIAETEGAEEMRAESEDVRGALDAGEAVVLDEAAIGRRLAAALDAWWVAHADDQPSWHR